jgi:hypothetical protein
VPRGRARGLGVHRSHRRWRRRLVDDGRPRRGERRHGRARRHGDGGRDRHGRRSCRAARPVGGDRARDVQGAEPGALAAAAPQQRRVPQHDHRPVRERARDRRDGARGDGGVSARARVARLPQQRGLPRRADAHGAEIPRRRRRDLDGRGRGAHLRDVRERHEGRDLRRGVHRVVRQAGVPPPAHDGRHGAVYGPLRKGHQQRLRFPNGHRVDRQRDVAVAAVPLPLRAQREARGRVRDAVALRDGLAPVLPLLAKHAGPAALHGGRRGPTRNASTDRSSGAAPARRSKGFASARVLQRVAQPRTSTRTCPASCSRRRSRSSRTS